MHRFRKRSDAKNTLPPLQVGLHLQTQYFIPDDASDHQDLLPELPSADDFRTSLILPDLTRRFSLLRDSSGDPLSVDVLKSRLADQRARGAENQISEEEEEMILETLGLRPKTPQLGDRSQENLTDSMRQSVRSTATTNSLTSSISSSPSGRSKRYSNNLFGSGRLRDYSYARLTSAARSPNKNITLSTDSTNPVTSNIEDTRLHSNQTQSDSVPTAITPDTLDNQPFSISDSQEIKLTGSSVYKRASLALAQAIRELEEDAEDEVVMPRSIPIPRSGLEHSKEHGPSHTLEQYEAGMAISSDVAATPELEATRASPILSRVSPGYVPGMPRPMTPHEDFEHDLLRSHSTTPRATATSPVSSDLSQITPPSLIAGLLNHGPSSTLPRQSSGRPTSPPSSSTFLHRKASVQSGDKERPSSPLTGTFLHYNAVSQRPSTPSNVTWTFPSNKISPQKAVHTRSGSWFSDAGVGSIDTHESYESSKSHTARSLRSPALPDSPLITPTHSTMLSFSSKHSGTSDYRPWSPVSGLDINAPIASINRTVRSPTPTQTSPTRSPTSPTFSSFDVSSKNGSRRSSKQNSSSQFSLSAFNPVVFSPIANSSRSSLESVGSSYHSGDGDRIDRLAAFVDIESPEPAWHDISFPTHSTTPGGSPDFEWNAEDVITRTGGISKSDISAIQEKLVGFAFAKTSPPMEARERAPSLRRRRPSTSQSNYSFNGRIASPPPQLQGQTSNSLDQLSPKATALLKSVVDSIQSPQNHSTAPVPTGTTGEEDDGDISPSTRRNRDLAQILFGNEDAGLQEDSFIQTHITTPVGQEESPVAILTENEVENEKSDPVVTPNISIPNTPLVETSNFSTPVHYDADADLTREVQRKAEAAMMALRKPYPSSKDGFGSTTSLPRKRIAPHQISTPTLVSASTSVDTIPLRPPPIAVGQQSSKLGSRFKKLKGTLKKNSSTPTGEEVTPYPLDIQITPPPAQTIQYDPRKLHPIAGVATSATELGRFNVPATPIAPVPSPPASAGPGLKGFMARFRGKQRATDPVMEQDRTLRTVPMRSEKFSTKLSSVPAINEDASVSYPSSPPVQSFKPDSSPSSSPPTLPSMATTSAEESAALRQLFDAATNLGLDQEKLNDLLLVRSGSTSSKSTDWTMLTRTNSAIKTKAGSHEQNTSEKAAAPSGADVVDNHDRLMSRKPSARQTPEPSRRPRERSVDPASVVVRRTIFFPSDNKGVLPANISALARKASARRRRASATSVSSRSVHERVPTPPPRRASLSRRLSTDTPPPVPPISPLVASRPDGFLSVPSGSIDKGSAYDSFYEMYTDENTKASNSDNNPRNTAFPDSGQGIEFIELANGETIWQIVNGLRDDDADSLYTGRTSFASEYDNDEGVQLFFKEHARSGSKGSSSSFFSKRKSVKANGNSGNTVRPETKVFFSSSAHIGRLIENLSQGLDAGSFNIMPNQTNTGYSATSSLSEGDMQYSMEEKLDRLLGRIERGET